MEQQRREILFRGKRMDNGEWVKGSLVHQTYFYGNQVDNYHILVGGEFDFDNYDNYIVIPETVGQYTGLTDKNGVKIFEGDLFWHKWNGKYKILMSVVFEDGEFRLQKAKYYEFVVWNIRISGENESLEIVGNIYDNPELMKDGGNK